MADLEKIMAETSKTYDASRKALNDQINAISGDLAAQQQRINAQYAQQGKNLDNQRNWQAQASSMAASRNGGSFGGSAEIANKKYYQQAYVPAVTQMQTNQANDISSAESQANQNRLNLENTLAQLNDEANRVAIQRYDTAVQAEKDEAYRQAQLREQQRQHNAQMALQRAQLAADQEYKKWLQQQQSTPTYKNWDFGNGYSVQEMPNGEAAYYKGKKQISAGEFLSNAKLGNWDTWNDIWNNNGVSTKGVGWDTIKAFKNMYQTQKNGTKNSSQYGYLWSD